MDKYPRDFDNPDPLLFSESPEDADAFSRQGRIINWISRIVRNRSECPFIPFSASHSVLQGFIEVPRENKHNMPRTTWRRFQRLSYLIFFPETSKKK